MAPGARPPRPEARRAGPAQLPARRPSPRLAGYQFFAYYHAAYNVGGDYYDFVPLPGDRLGIALADVSGKGIPAALMMAKFSGNTRYCILTEDVARPRPSPSSTTSSARPASRSGSSP